MSQKCHIPVKICNHLAFIKQTSYWTNNHLLCCMHFETPYICYFFLSKTEQYLSEEMLLLAPISEVSLLNSVHMQFSYIIVHVCCISDILVAFLAQIFYLNGTVRLKILIVFFPSSIIRVSELEFSTHLHNSDRFDIFLKYQFTHLVTDCPRNGPAISLKLPLSNNMTSDIFAKAEMSKNE